MKKITRTFYRATDGEEFDSKEQCLKYESDGCVELESLPKYGDHVPITEKALNWMLNGDGDCLYATATKRSRISAHRAPHPSWATHLIYFGK